MRAYSADPGQTAPKSDQDVHCKEFNQHFWTSHCIAETNCFTFMTIIAIVLSVPIFNFYSKHCSYLI